MRQQVRAGWSSQLKLLCRWYFNRVISHLTFDPITHLYHQQPSDIHLCIIKIIIILFCGNGRSSSQMHACSTCLNVKCNLYNIVLWLLICKVQAHVNWISSKVYVCTDWFSYCLIYIIMCIRVARWYNR